MKHFLVIIGFFLFSCGSKPQVILEDPLESSKEGTTSFTDKPQSLETKNKKPEKVEQSIIENIEFDYKLKKLKNRLPEYELIGFLKNKNKDTVYFLSQSCHYEYASIQCDKSKFWIGNKISCVASNPIVYKISPNESHEFEANLDVKTNDKNLKIGFDFYAVTKDFGFEDYKAIRIFDRPEKEKTIIWAKEKTLR